MNKNFVVKNDNADDIIGVVVCESAEEFQTKLNKLVCDMYEDNGRFNEPGDLKKCFENANQHGMYLDFTFDDGDVIYFFAQPVAIY